MIPFAWRLLILAVVFVSGCISGAHYVRIQWAESDAIAVEKATTMRAKAIQTARETEQRQQEIVNAITTNLEGERDAIRASLSADLDRLRKQPAHVVRIPGMPKTAEADCASAAGGEFSERGAEALVRLAARAAEIQEGLRACYNYADSLQGAK